MPTTFVFAYIANIDNSAFETLATANSGCNAANSEPIVGNAF